MNDRYRSLSRLRDIDWDFTGAFSESPFSASHWHPGRFASQLPAALIGNLSREGDIVLDPFAGSGTTLVEAQRLLRRSIGIDLNPISTLVCKAKTLTQRADDISKVIEYLRQEAISIIGSTIERSLRTHITSMPSTVQKDKWYTPNVAQDLALLWKQLTSYQDDVKTTLGTFAFSSILLSVCRETRHWGYVCDNTTPQDNREGNVLEAYIATLDQIEKAYKDRDTEILARIKCPQIPESHVICADVSEALASVKPESIDLVVTSPPYFGVCDYIKSQRLSLEWMGVELENLRLREVGARSKRHRRTARTEYMQEMLATLDLLRGRLKPHGVCVFILGESASRPGIISEFCDMFSQANFRLLLDLNRTVSSQRRQAPSIKGEHLLVIERIR